MLRNQALPMFRRSCVVFVVVATGPFAGAQSQEPRTGERELVVQLFAEGASVGDERSSGAADGTIDVVTRRETRPIWEPWTWVRREVTTQSSATVRRAANGLAGVDQRLQVDAVVTAGAVRIVGDAVVWGSGDGEHREPVPAGAVLVPDGLSTPWFRALSGPLPRAMALLPAAGPRLVVGTIGPGPAGRFVQHDEVRLESLRIDFGEFAIDVWRDGTTPAVMLDSRTGVEARRATRPGWAAQSMRITLAPATVREEDVRVANGALQLAGVLATPRLAPPRVAALLLSGSGPDGSDARIGGMPFLDRIAGELAAAGVASLRYADRGVGGSGGSFVGIRVADLQADAAAALAFLRARHPGIPAVILGHSEGAVIAARLAAATPDLRGVVLLGCPARPITEVIVQQTPALLAELGGIAVEEADRLARRFADAARCPTAFLTTGTGEVVPVGWIQDHAALRPAELVAGLSCRVELFQGLADRNVAPANVDELEVALRANGRTFAVHRLPGLDHAFVAAPAAGASHRARGMDSRFLQRLVECILALRDGPGAPK